MSSAALHEAQFTAARGNEFGVTGFVLDKTILALLFISLLSPSCLQIIYLLLSGLMCNSSALLANRLYVFPVFQALPSVSKDSSYHSWDGLGLNSPEVCYRADMSNQKTSHLPTHSLDCLFQPETVVLTTLHSLSMLCQGRAKSSREEKKRHQARCSSVSPIENCSSASNPRPAHVLRLFFCCFHHHLEPESRSVSQLCSFCCFMFAARFCTHLW